jgi:hypothetical protein
MSTHFDKLAYNELGAIADTRRGMNIFRRRRENRVEPKEQPFEKPIAKDFQEEKVFRVSWFSAG